jgi:CO/xanthine dehydrogenase FAD-binding subunit
MDRDEGNMIIEYQRPATLEEAIQLLQRKTPRSVPMGGGTILSKSTKDEIAAIDLQQLGLNKITVTATTLILGATATISMVADDDKVPEYIRNLVRQEATTNIRNAGTLAGTFLSTDGTSVMTPAFLAVDASLIWVPGGAVQKLEEYKETGTAPQDSLLITEIFLDPQWKLAFEVVRKTPRDVPMISVFVARDPSGNERIILAGACKKPTVYKPAKRQQTLDEVYEQYDKKMLPKEYFTSIVPVLIARAREVLE